MVMWLEFHRLAQISRVPVESCSIGFHRIGQTLNPPPKRSCQNIPAPSRMLRARVWKTMSTFGRRLVPRSVKLIMPLRQDMGASWLAFRVLRVVNHACPLWQVLMAAGISTPSLREIAHQGVNITGAAHSEVTMPLLFLMPLNFIGAVKLFFNIFYLNKAWVIIPCMEGLTVLLRIHLLFMLSWSPPDVPGDCIWDVLLVAS